MSYVPSSHLGGGALIGRIDLQDPVGNPGVPYPHPLQPSSRLMPNDQIIGTCSKCRGPVCVPALVGSVIPPTPICRQCGAKKKPAYGPVIEME